MFRKFPTMELSSSEREREREREKGRERLSLSRTEVKIRSMKRIGILPVEAPGRNYDQELR